MPIHLEQSAENMPIRKSINKNKIFNLGILGDWDNPYLTKDFGYEANIVRALGKIVENNHISKGYKPVHWCTE
ncbi:Isoleucyl-tRNA synthetase (EC, partial [uncultured Gammaproteobacteria bacterium]